MSRTKQARYMRSSSLETPRKAQDLHRRLQSPCSWPTLARPDLSRARRLEAFPTTSAHRDVPPVVSLEYQASRGMASRRASLRQMALSTRSTERIGSCNHQHRVSRQCTRKECIDENRERSRRFAYSTSGRATLLELSELPTGRVAALLCARGACFLVYMLHFDPPRRANGLS